MDQLEHTKIPQVPLYAHMRGFTSQPFNFDTFHAGEQGFKVSENGKWERTPTNTGVLEDFSGFVQRWLFFGLLYEMFHDTPGFSIGKYFKPDANPTGARKGSVNTTELHQDLKRWYAHERSNKHDQISRLIHKQYVLERARYFVREFCSVSSKYIFETEQPRNREPIWAEVNEKIAFSIMALGQTLGRALGRIQRATSLELKEWQSHDESIEGWGYSKMIVDELLQEKHWCPHAIHYLFLLFRYNSIGLWYISKLSDIPPSDAQTHQGCKSAVNCTSIAPDLPKVPHSPKCRREDRINCKRVGPKQDALLEAIRSGKTPLLKYEAGAQPDERVSVIEMEPSLDLEYVMFSHMYSDDVGKPRLNESEERIVMQECVFSWFSNIFEDISQHDSPQPFWIDSICIPNGKDEKTQELRTMAMQEMHSLYTHADYTVVLDSGLLKAQKEEHITMAVKMIVCKWMSRLWTLQEAVLSRNLYFKLEDCLQPLTELDKELERYDRLKPSCVPSTVRAFYHNMLGDDRAEIHKHESPEWKLSPTFVGRVLKAARWRKTAYPEQETLALATLLKLPTADFSVSLPKGSNEIREAELDRRMQILLDHLSRTDPCAIPPGIIFLPGERLTGDGYRWAPRTWMQAYHVEPPDPIMISGSAPRLNPPNGLEVQFPGFRLHDLSTSHQARASCNEIMFATGSSLRHWHSLAVADDLETRRIFTEEDLVERPDIAVILPQYPLLNPKEIGLLVSVKDKRGKFLYVQILNRVWVSREVGHEKVEDHQKRFKRKEHTPFSVGQRLNDSQWWCVDGQPKAPASQHENEPKPGPSKAPTWSHATHTPFLTSQSRSFTFVTSC